MSLVTLVETELVRFFRRRDALAWFLAAGVFGALPLVDSRGWIEPDWRFAWAAAVVDHVGLVRSLAATGELLLLLTLAFALPLQVCLGELRSGAWRLLLHAPVPRWKLLAGRALGFLACFAVVHAFFATLQALTTPLVNEPHARVLGHAVAPLVLAAFVLPDALAEAIVRSTRREAYGRFRLAQVGRLIAGSAVLFALLSGDLAERGRALADAAVMLPTSPVDAFLALPRPGATIAALLLVDGALSALAWRRIVLGEASA